ncbi:hypothetical protein M0R45_036844 [Rubus argutus]|uniref:Uncharacterized protein n=1 Tax=Rubus argutus TaxID=59490 RepID=A0AAW1W0V0_RUBAR
MGEAVLGAFISVLLEKLSHPDVLNYFGRLKKVNQKKLEKWTTTLREIEEVLDDAEEKRLTKQQGVISWLDDLRDLAYDVEDVLDKFLTEMLRRRLKQQQWATTGKLWGPFSKVQFNFDMNSKIKELNDRLLEICQRKDRFGLRKIGTSSTKEGKIQVPPSSCQPVGPVIGREEDKRKIVEFLSKEEPSSDIKFHVVAIVGMPGVGKTTLAGDVFNDAATQQFYPKGWVSVSDDFDIVRLTKEILEYVTSQPCNLESFSKAQDELGAILSGKKFLIVLDDVWVKHDYDLDDLWTRLQSPFSVGAPGSKIVVTTRDGKVARIMGASEVHSLECVSEDHCLEIFEQYAFRNRINSDRPPEVLKTKIAGKCGGLPLAARTLGGILCYKDLHEWEDLLENKLWSLFDETNILSVLKMSYHYLPSKLKRCFAYCSVLPHDYEFEEKQLILLWMAEGLIQPQPGKAKQMEDCGHEYFRELFFRSLFQKSSKNSSKYVMHDLVTDMAQWAAGEICFRLDDKPEDNSMLRYSPKARHLSYIYGEYDGVDRFETIFEVIQLRTFLPLSLSNYSPRNQNFLTRNVTYELLPKQQYARVLSLNGYTITELPDSIGKLTHLRYLDLSHTEITSLPESTSNLCNLQTLLLEGCYKLKALPTNMRNLINLRHLNNSGVPLLEAMPPQLGQLTNLQSLSNFVVGKGNGSGISEIGSLLHLQGTFQLSRLENVIGVGDASSANLNGKVRLEALLLVWSDSSVSTEIAAVILDMLQPHRNLKELTISGYAGLKFSTWLGDPSFSNMVVVRLPESPDSLAKLEISYCQELVISLSNYEQLHELSIHYCKGVVHTNAVGLTKVKELLESIAFSNVSEFRIQSGEFVKGLSNVKELRITGCAELTSSFQNEDRLLQHLISLRRLEINGNLTLVEEVGKEAEELLQSQMLACKLEYLKLENCGSLLKVPEGLHHLTFLQELCIDSCSSLESFPDIGLPHSLKIMQIWSCESLMHVARYQIPPSLRRLSIWNCDNLKSLIEKEEEGCVLSPSFDCLEYLSIQWCSSLMSLSLKGQFTRALKKLIIYGCRQLESIPNKFHESSCLDEIYIDERSNLKFLPESLCYLTNIESLPRLGASVSAGLALSRRAPSKSNLRKISIGYWVKLEVRFNMHNLNSLQELSFAYFEGLTSFLEAGEGFPPNLISLKISGIMSCKALLKSGGFLRLTSLRELELKGREDP